MSTESGLDSDDDVFAELERLGLDEEEAFFFGAQSMTWSVSLDHKREKRKHRQLSDRLELHDESTVLGTGPDRMSELKKMVESVLRMCLVPSAPQS